MKASPLSGEIKTVNHNVKLLSCLKNPVQCLKNETHKTFLKSKFPSVGGAGVGRPQKNA
jgi:hypothetical protein